ncbi:AI-2E family transporter [Parabacteroides chinchillae]|uniref:Predicted PurR-regulated permease PerM n=1 Tax=Parabacteroides chinchillae TaxID=871327 RepID=A0A8G2F2R2_9BACT|nr:AI-2E family transporter [Parabacteroides chinchillae]SEF85254.1 Predicted PurR-regulated permease PerM [Parabacteroides chinchillae]
MSNIKEQYWQYSLITIILVLGIILFLKITPFLGGLLGAVTIYTLVRKQMLYLTEKRRFRHSWVALLMLGEAVLCFLIPISLAVWLLINKIQYVNLDTGALISNAQHVIDLIQQKTGFNVLDKENLMSVAGILPKIGQALMGSISSFVVNIVVLLFVLYFMLIGGRKMESYIYDILPFNPKNKSSILSEINMIVTSNAIGIPLLAIIQGLVALIGYFIFKTSDPVLFGFLTCIATIIPIVGTALVWFPLVVYMALTGDWINAIGLTIYALVVITNVDNLIRFILQKKMADTHPLITIFGVVIGLSLFGFMGIIFGPLLLSIFFLCVDLFKKEYLDNKQSS